MCFYFHIYLSDYFLLSKCAGERSQYGVVILSKPPAKDRQLEKLIHLKKKQTEFLIISDQVMSA